MGAPAAVGVPGLQCPVRQPGLFFPDSGEPREVLEWGSDLSAFRSEKNMKAEMEDKGKGTGKKQGDRRAVPAAEWTQPGWMWGPRNTAEPG